MKTENDIVIFEERVTSLIKLLEVLGVTIDKIMNFFSTIKKSIKEFQTSQVEKVNQEIGTLYIHKNLMDSLHERGLDDSIYSHFIRDDDSSVWLKNNKNVFVAINHSFLNKIGVTSPKVLGKVLREIPALNEDTDNFLNSISRVTPLLELDTIDGVELDVSGSKLTKYSINDEDGNMIAILGVFSEGISTPSKILTKDEVTDQLRELLKK